jgi:serine/threonine protein kinase
VHINEFQVAPSAGGELKGRKKVRALASSNVEAVTDLCNCSADQADELDVKSVLRHQAIVPGTAGSYSCLYREVAVLGQGAFGKVTHVRSLLDHAEYAVKMTTDDQELTDADVKRVFLEAQLMRQIYYERSSGGVHSAAVEYHGMWIEKMEYKNQQRYRVFLRMELCKRNLASMLEDHRFSEQELIDIIKSVSVSIICSCICPCVLSTFLLFVALSKPESNML